MQPGHSVSFDVPADAIGFNVIVSGDTGARVGVAQLIDPAGNAVVRDYVPDGSDTELALGNRGLGTFSVPSTNATATQPLASGRWSVTVNGLVPTGPVDKSGTSRAQGDPITGALHVTVKLQRTGDGAFHGGQLDLHVYVPQGLHVQDPDPVHVVTNPSSDASIGKRVDFFYEELLRLFDIGRGTVTFHSMDARFAHATTGDDRAQLIAQASVESGPALHVVLTNELSYGGGQTLLGYSVGLPGAMNTAGTVRSAIAVALYDDGTANNDAITFVHEMGHFAGLMHSTDYDGTPDLLGDTPVCTGSEKVCSQNDDNLMAPDGPAHAAVVSPSQVRVVQGAPFYRATRAR